MFRALNNNTDRQKIVSDEFSPDISLTFRYRGPEAEAECTMTSSSSWTVSCSEARAAIKFTRSIEKDGVVVSSCCTVSMPEFIGKEGGLR